MKIIDFEKKGNMVKFYLGDDNLKEWYGDDWYDIPYERSAGTVYDKYVKDTKVITFDFDDTVLEPCEDFYYGDNYYWCKDDMVKRLVPCIIVVSKKLNPYDRHEFTYFVGTDGIKKYYFGDSLTF